MEVDVAACFEAGLADWQTKLQADEWYFANLRSGLVTSVSATEAFENIGGVVELVLRLRDEYLCSEAADLLLDLVRHSETTQVHPILEQNWERLIAHVSSFGEYQQNQAQDISRWYRRGHTAR
jgi:hypothetical protein